MTRAGSLRSLLPLGRRKPRVYLHIGAMKTGTSYLQGLMEANQAELAGAGVLFPGQTWADQARAARDVLEFNIRDPDLKARTQGAWARVVDEMLSHQGTASVFSMEFLSYANAQRATRVVESFRGAEVHVVLTVRDAATALPAQWQTSCRNAGTLPWPKMVTGLRQVVRDDGPPWSRAARMFQRTQGTIRMLDVWAPLVGSDNVHVVTAPPRGSDPRLLWRRFADVVGVDPDVALTEPARSNPSVFGHPTTEFLRRVNVELGRVARGDAERMVLDRMRAGLREQAEGERPVIMPRRGLALAATWNRRVRRAVEARGVHLVGDLRDLPVRAPGASAPSTTSEPTPAEIVAIAAVAEERLLALAEELLALGGTGATTTGPSAAAASGPNAGPGDETRAVRDVAELVRRCARYSRQVHDTGQLEALADAAARSASD